MRNAVIVLLFLSLGIAARAEAQAARNAVYFELGGSAIAPSINYERRFTDFWYGRVGASIVTGETEGESDSDTTFIVPLSVARVSHPAANHHFEIGGGITIAAGDEQDLFDQGDEETFSTVFATGIIGYRFQRPGRGFQFRAVLTPVVGGGDFLPWAGVSFGYAW